MSLSSRSSAGRRPGGELTDHELIVRYCARRSRSAFDALVRRHQRGVYSLALRIVRDADDAADVTQRTFVRAMSGLDRFEGRSSFRTWLYRVAVNLAKNHLRDEGRRATVDLDNVLPIAGTAAVGPRGIITREELMRVRAAVERLPSKQQLTFKLRAYQELSFREVAEVMQCRAGTAKVNYHHAIKRLRRELTVVASQTRESEEQSDG